MFLVGGLEGLCGSPSLLSIQSRSRDDRRNVLAPQSHERRVAVEPGVEVNELGCLHPGSILVQCGERLFQPGQRPTLGKLPGWIRESPLAKRQANELPGAAAP